MTPPPSKFTIQRCHFSKVSPTPEHKFPWRFSGIPLNVFLSPKEPDWKQKEKAFELSLNSFTTKMFYMILCEELKNVVGVPVSPLDLFTPSKTMNSSHASETVIQGVGSVSRVDREQSGKQVRRSAAKALGGTVMHGSTEIPTSTLPPAGRMESVATLGFHSGWEDGERHPTAMRYTLSRCWHLD